LCETVVTLAHPASAEVTQQTPDGAGGPALRRRSRPRRDLRGSDRRSCAAESTCTCRAVSSLSPTPAPRWLSIDARPLSTPSRGP